MNFYEKIRILVCAVLMSAPVVGDDQLPEKTVPIETVIGQIVNVLSGDVVEMLLPGGQLVRVELLGIEAPDHDMPFSGQSRAWLASELTNQLVSADCRNDGTTLSASADLRQCIVFPDDRDINYASLYFGYSRREIGDAEIHDDLLYRMAENHARENKVGVWSVLPDEAGK